MERLWVYKSNARASGESSTGTQDTPVAHLWITTGLRHKFLSDEMVMAVRPVNDNERNANGNRRDTMLNTRALASLRVTVITVESGDTSSKTVDTRTMLPKWMRKNLSKLQTAVRAAARHESQHHLLVRVHLELRSPRRERSPP